MGSNTEESDSLMGTDMGVEADDAAENCLGSDVELPMAEADEVIDDFIGKEVTATNEVVSIEPFVGMHFESEEAAKIFYNAYARCLGFSIRVGHNRRSKRDGENISRQFVCSREGFRHKKYLNREDRVVPPRPATRLGCKAMIMVNRRGPFKWVVSKFEKLHNHNLEGPSNDLCLRLQRHVPNITGGVVDRFWDAHVAPVMSTCVEEADLIRSVGYTEQDCRKYLGTGQQRVLEKGDAQTVLDYLKHMQVKDPAFFYAIQVNEEERMTNFFWADSRSRIAYDYFGDVVIFNTTYKTHMYRVPFAPFIGVNHHQQPVLFGCALLQDESEASFIWLFRTWLEAMLRCHPKSIITTQEPAMGAAVARVFPETAHRICMWHIFEEVPESLGKVYHAHEMLDEDFEKCVNQTLTVEEFESSWELLIDRYDLRGNQWLQSLYNIRKRWVPAYLRDIFFAGLSTTERGEIVNSLFDGYVTAKTTLQEFVTQYEKALENQYKNECEADFDSYHSEPILKTPLPMEQQAAEVYTRVMFLKFQEELLESLCYVPNISGEDREMIVYRVVKFGEDNRSYTVTFDISKTIATCTCLLFEFTGILCRHALIVFRIRNILKLPSYYILKRWTKNAKKGVLRDCPGMEIQAKSQGSRILRYNDLCHQAIRYAEEGAASPDAYNVAVHALRKALEEVLDAKKNDVADTRGASVMLAQPPLEVHGPCTH